MSNPDILTPAQKDLMRFLFSNAWFRRHFYLTGGTALAAFHLHHRYSDDLDFFSHGVELKAVPNLMREAAKGIGQPVETVQASPGFLRFHVGEGLKVDVVADTEFRVGAPELAGEFMVDSLKNIAVNKVCCILGRLEAKDFVDLHGILKEGRLDVFELLELGRQKDGGLDAFVWASLLGDVTKLGPLPSMIQPMERRDLERFFLGLRDRILDRLKPKLRR